MSEASRSDKGWTPWQNDRVVAAYFELDRVQRSGGHLVKTHLYERLSSEIGRPPGGIELKFQNISRVLETLGLDYATGLKPRPNIQQSLADAVERHLDQNPSLLIREPDEPQVDVGAIIEVPPPAALGQPRKIERTLERIARKHDYAARDARNRKLGELGEQLVLQRERWKLNRAGKDDLAREVRHVSALDGDGVGYDIRSFEPSGEERLIEVKTTNGPDTTDFFLSRTEHQVSNERPDAWRLHRVYLFSSSPGIFIMPAPIEAYVNVMPEIWRAHFS